MTQNSTAAQQMSGPPVRRWCDVAAGWALFPVVCALALFAGYLTVFFTVEDDDCVYKAQICHPRYVDWAVGVSWGGILCAVVGSLVMLIVSTLSGRRVWIWPVLAIALIMFSLCTGLAFLAQVVEK
ncbi:hypothetical protein [Nocardia sp. NPDC056000]|uniref:hypothetical protein n=1 Tax=Nocardia sp. NPDC056000 TaxID=3345674 RepID=UPI0035D6E76E